MNVAFQHFERDARPPEQPLAMPAQDFKAPPAKRQRGPRSALWRKAFVGAVSVALTLLSVREMYMVLSVAEMTTLEWLVLGLFSVNFCWIAFAFVSATAGFVTVLTRGFRRRIEAEPGYRVSSRTVLAFPIYNEDVARVFANIKATAEALADQPPGAFEIFILSDTTNPEIALEEEAAFQRLNAGAGPAIPVFYRRRTRNIARKSGNVHDFVSRWGGRYEHMLVFDADSYLDASTMIELVRRMERSPETGLIQTIPRLVGGKTLFARWQQFAASAYGPFLGAGIGWWGQNEGNFWGHNAIIRVRAFAEAAGLPVMPGGTPFGGAILSHDFVEAALLRKAGWRVEIASDLEGSWEESPPTILDLTIRDRRWCQGNLQHIGVLLRARGLAWTSRLHLMTGVMAYLASPMWLMLILAGMALSLQGNFLRPDYFGEASLFPTWPVIDSARALRLFFATMILLFAPKLYGLVLALASASWRRAAGVFGTVCSVLVEIVISMLIAPILMAAQTSAVAAVLSGRDGGWSPQARDAGGHPIALLARRHALTTFFGIALFASALIISPVFAAWLSPAALGLIFSIPISKATGSVRAGKAFRRLGLMVTPSELSPPPSYRGALQSVEAFRDIDAPAFSALLQSRRLRERRAGLVDGHWALDGADVYSPLVIGAAKAKKAGDAARIDAVLSAAEKTALLNCPATLQSVSADETVLEKASVGF